MTKEQLNKLANELSDEIKRDFTQEDLINMLIRKKQALEQALQDAKQVRQNALELTNNRLGIEKVFNTRSANIIDEVGIKRLQRLAGITNKINEEIKYNTGVSSLMGACGTSGQSRNIIIDEFNNTYEENSFDHLQDSEFKESVKKLYESYKIN